MTGLVSIRSDWWKVAGRGKVGTGPSKVAASIKPA
jgi:hypothetical protein